MIEPLDPDIAAHYQVADERARLRQSAAGQLELVRTQEILRRYLPTPPARVLDVGGGPGIYATWLAADGYDVELFDPVELHVQQAQEAAEVSERAFVARLGDARNLPVPPVSSDAVLLLGPLYHLNAAGRALALAEAARVVRPSGLVVAAAISRFASLLDGLVWGWLGEEDFLAIVRHDLAAGEHRNPDPVGRPEWFTTAWFHRPEELRQELVEAGLAVEAVVAVEGPAWLLAGLDQRWENDGQRQSLLDAVRAVESEASLLGASAHLLAVARKPPR